MSEGPPPSAPPVPAPDEREVPDPAHRYDAMQVFQSLIEIQKDISSISAKTERLVTDVGKLDNKISNIETSLALARGFGLAAVILIPICAAIIWWLIGANLERLRDQLLNASKSGSTQQVAPLASPPSLPSVRH
jgi:hypothetical protein